MIVTPGSISMLIAGAKIADLDVTAVREDGKQFFAGLLQCEDDAKLRKCMAIEEFQPILQVVSRTWLGSYGRFPNIKFVVTGGSEEMTMRVSYRKTEFPVIFLVRKVHLILDVSTLEVKSNYWITPWNWNMEREELLYQPFESKN